MGKYFFRILAIGLLCGAAEQPGNAESAPSEPQIEVAEHKHIWGGDEVPGNTHYSGLGRPQVAWSGRVCALAYYDGPHEGKFIIFVDENGQMLGDPAQIGETGDAVWVFWTGDCFVAVCSSKGKSTLLRFSEQGELESECILRAHKSGFKEAKYAAYSDGVIYLIVHEYRDFDGVDLYRFSPNGQQLGYPVWFTTRGEVEDAVFFDERVAFITRPRNTFKANTLQVFGLDGHRISLPMYLGDELYRSSIAKNEGNLILIWQNVTDEKKQTLRMRLYGPDAKILAESPGIPLPDVYGGSANFDSRVFPAKDVLLALCDTSCGTDGEDIYAHLFDLHGRPLGELLQLNSRPLDQVDYCCVYTGDGFTLFTIEKGPNIPSFEWLRLKVEGSPPVQPPLLSEMQATSEPAGPSSEQAIEADEGRIHIVSQSRRLCHLHIRGNQVWYETEIESDLRETVINDNFWEPLEGADNSFKNLDPPLPQKDGYTYWLEYVKSPGLVMIEQIPSANNNYELILQLYLRDQRNRYGHEFAVCWSNNPPPTPTPFPTPYVRFRGGVQNAMIRIHRGQVTVQEFPVTTPTPVYETVISNPLPAYAVDVTVQIVESGQDILVIDQPRLENDYTASIAIRHSGDPFARHYHDVVIQWGDRIEEPPTSTPWPTWAAGAPTPTPVESIPNVLWCVKKSCFPANPTQFQEDWLKFKGIIGSFGVRHCELSTFPKSIDIEFLQNYDVVIFGPSERLEPLNQKEQEAILEYVRGGGSILVAPEKMDIDDILEPTESALFASSITEPFGIRYSKVAIGNQLVFEPPHFLNRNAQFLFGRMSRLVLSGKAEAAASFDSGDVLLAYAEDDYGRVIAITDHGAFSTLYLNMPSEPLAYNAGAWLLHRDDFVLPTPIPKPLRKRRSPSLWDQIVETFKQWH